jgi:hypothetical protein
LDEREGEDNGGDVAIMLKRAIKKEQKKGLVRGGGAVGENAKMAYRNNRLQSGRRRDIVLNGGRRGEVVTNQKNGGAAATAKRQFVDSWARAGRGILWKLKLSKTRDGTDGHRNHTMRRFARYWQ